MTINRDATPPEVSFSGNLGSYTVDDHVTITCSASDAMSGIADDTCVEAGIGGGAYALPLGVTTITAEATDAAGNVGAGSTTFTVTVSYGSLCVLVERWVPQQGVARSLCATLDTARAAGERGQENAKANAIEAFVREVMAQEGRAVPAERADLLIELARAL